MSETLTEEQQVELYRQWQVSKVPEINARLKQLGIRYPERTWRDIKPYEGSPVPLAMQQKIIDTVRAKQDEGWAFFGLPGVGKTTLADLLFRTAMWHRMAQEHDFGFRVIPNSIWRITARGLCQQAQDRITHTGDDGEDMCFDVQDLMRRARARVDRHTIERVSRGSEGFEGGLKPHLFIEEWDKVGLTDFRRETLFDILDAMYQVDGQLVITSNLTWPDYCATFGGTSWRLNKICNICRIEDVNKPEIRAKEA